MPKTSDEASNWTTILLLHVTLACKLEADNFL